MMVSVILELAQLPTLMLLIKVDVRNIQLKCSSFLDNNECNTELKQNVKITKQ